MSTCEETIDLHEEWLEALSIAEQAAWRQNFTVVLEHDDAEVSGDATCKWSVSVTDGNPLDLGKALVAAGEAILRHYQRKAG
jgi:hypothetical protein